MQCHHYIMEDRLGPEFGKVTRDGIDYPVLIDPGYVDISDDAVVAEPVFYEKGACPICQGGECPEGD